MSEETAPYGNINARMVEAPEAHTSMLAALSMAKQAAQDAAELVNLIRADGADISKICHDINNHLFAVSTACSLITLDVQELSKAQVQYECEVDVGPKTMELRLALPGQRPTFWLYEVASIEASKEGDSQIVYSMRNASGETIFSAWGSIATWTFKRLDVPPYYCDRFEGPDCNGHCDGCQWNFTTTVKENA